MKLQLLLLLLTTRSPLAAGTPAGSCTNPLEWTRDPDSYSVSEYADHRTQCTDKCNEVGHCCTLGAGGCNFASCSTGCHIAWFSENLAACKTECNRANSLSCSVSYQLKWFFIGNLRLHSLPQQQFILSSVHMAPCRD